MTTTDFVMPKLGLTMTEGTISRWGVTPGSRFETGDIIVVVETDKIAYDVEAPAPGILKEVLVSQGSVVPVGTPIGRWDVGDVKVSLDAPMIEAPAELPATAPTISKAMPVPPAMPRGEFARILATPYARRLAREAGIDLRQIDGSGPKARIKAADIGRAIAAGRLQTSPAVPAPVADKARAAISTAGVDIDVTALLDLDDQIKSQLPDLHAELVHYLVLATSRLSDSFTEPPIIGLAPNRESEGTVGIFAPEDCRTLRGVVAHSGKSTTASNWSSLRGTLWVDRALDGISFLSADPPSGWSASINVGSVRDEFRPDANGRPIRAKVVSVVLTWRAGEFDATSMQRLLSRIRGMLEAPLVLLAS